VILDKYECVACGYVYDPKEHNDVRFDELPQDYRCPNCGAELEMFHKVVIFNRANAPTVS